MIRPLLVLALLPFAACRGGDIASLESDNVGLQAEVDELTVRLEAMEAALAETQVAQQTSDSDLAALAVDVDELDAEVEAQVGLDLPLLLDEVSTNIDRLDALEAAGFATEVWVLEQGYGSDTDVQTALAGVVSNGEAIGQAEGALASAQTDRQALADGLTAEAAARMELEGTAATLAADLGQTQSTVSGLGTQLDSLSGSVADVSTEQELLREDLDETTSMVGDLDNTVGDMTSDLVSVVEDLSQVQDGLTGTEGRLDSTESLLLEQGDALAQLESRTDELDGQVSSLQDQSSDLQGEVSVLSGELSNVSSDASQALSATSDLQGELGVLSGELSNVSSDASQALSATSDLQGELGVLSGELSNVSADASQALSATSDLQGEIGDVQSALSTLQSDQDVLLEELANLDGTVSGVNEVASDNTGRIDSVESDLLDTLIDVDSVQMDLSALADEVSENSAAPRTIHRVVGQGNDGRDDGFLTGRELTFTKELQDSDLRVSWQDVRRCVGYCYGYWEAYIDGEPCAEPAAMRWWNHAYGGSNGVRNNNHLPATITGYCSATASGPIGAGEHTITIRVTHEGGAHVDWYAGWNNSPFVIEAEEIL